MSIFSKKQEADDFIDIEEYNKEKIQVKIITLQEVEDYKKVINALASEAVSVVNIKPLLQNDKNSAKMAIDRIKRTCRTFDADIAGFSADLIVVVPKGVEIYRKDRSTQQQTPSVAAEYPKLPFDE